MSTSTANNHFTFSLPSLSYIDTSLQDEAPHLVNPLVADFIRKHS